jgi:hypothetical protein
MLSSDLLAKLATYDTPTICNALEIISSDFRLQGFTRKPLVCPFPDLPPFVGYARVSSASTTTSTSRQAGRRRV